MVNRSQDQCRIRFAGTNVRYENGISIETETRFPTTKIHLITYSNDVFEKAKQLLVKEAEESGWFDTIKAYGPEDLTPNFKMKFGDILNQSRGGGYWIWRFDVIPTRLNEIDDNDILIFLDAGTGIQKQGKKKLDEYIDKLNKSEYGIGSFLVPKTERNWTSKAIFDYFDIDLESDIAKSNQLTGGFLIMKKCPHTMELFDEALNLLESDPYLITDKYTDRKSNPYLQENRHDQSITSILRKLMGTVIVDGVEKHRGGANHKGSTKNDPFVPLRRR